MGHSKVSNSQTRIQTYCIIVKGWLISKGSTGAIVVTPISAICKNVLYLLMVVGCTSAEGSEKSQYRVKVFGGGSDIHLK